MKCHFLKFIDLTSSLFCLAFILAGILVSLNRYWQYETFFYDFGIFDQAIWSVSKFQPPTINHLEVDGKWIFADHFNPSIFLLAPLYWITSKSEIILIAQAVIVGLSGVVLYRIGKQVLNNRLLAFSVLVSYLLFVGLQNAVISDFHEVTISTLPLMLVFWAIFQNKVYLYFIFLLLTLGFKESNFLLGAGIGVATIFIKKEWQKIGFLAILISLLFGFLSIKLIIPFFSGGGYHYSPLSNSGFSNPLWSLVDSPIKKETIFYSFFSFGFLPILSPQFWLIVLQDFVIRFIPQTPTRWNLGLHYSAQLASILGVASIYGFTFLGKLKISRNFLNLFAFLLILNSIFLYRFILHGPLALSYNFVFYNHTSKFKFLDDLIGKVPKEGSVMAQNNLATRFTHRKVFLFKDDYYIYKPDYIVLDLRDGQNPNNFFGVKDLDKTIKNLESDLRYSKIYKKEKQYIFKKNT